MGRIEDLTGKRFGRLIAISVNEEVSKQKGRTYWNCKCDCGNIKPIMAKHLKGKTIQSCGCLQKERTSEANKKDLTNKRFGRLIAIEEYSKDKDGYKWLCECDCGNKIIVSVHNLSIGNTKSCGCLHRDKTSENMKQLRKEWEQNEDYKQMQSEKLKQQWKEEEFKNAHVIMMYKRWEDEEYREAHSGENCHWYNPNLTEEDRQNRRIIEGYYEWTNEVKKQANWTCDICGRHGGNMNAHHLDGYNWCKEGRTDITNGVCLCEQCHNEFHNINGRGNNTKEQYIEFKENKNKGEIINED